MSRREGVEFVGIFETSDARAAEICAKHNCPRFATIEEIERRRYRLAHGALRCWPYSLALLERAIDDSCKLGMWHGLNFEAQRYLPYPSSMPQNFPKTPVADYKGYVEGDSRDWARTARDVLMGLPRLENLPASRATRAAITGGK